MVCKAAGPSLADSLQPLAFRPNVASEVFSKGIAMKDVHLDRLSWFYFLVLVVCLRVIYHSFML